MGVWKSEHTVITAKGMQLLSDLAGKKPLVISKAVIIQLRQSLRI